jgi:NAD(P)-dependent dehydrogenase (short-subunit alcohol dehydrogenase family)
MRFEKKVFIVTGGGTGIGRATSIRLVKEGATVVIANRSEKNAMETLEQIEGSAGKAIFVKTDPFLAFWINGGGVKERELTLEIS